MENERRTDERVEKSLEANWEGLSGRYQGRISDIGLGGCFIDTHGTVEVGEIVSFEIKLPEGGSLPLRGEVAFYHPNIGFSLCFTFLTDEEQEQIRQLMTS
ncbi:MAG TPA: PilZ domain-containing protein [Pyrinomonadaceae bacterium]|jgi:Tfp pilus assembly protein PilZ